MAVFLIVSYYLLWLFIISAISHQYYAQALLIGWLIVFFELAVVWCYQQISTRLLYFIGTYVIVGLAVDFTSQALRLISFSGGTPIYLSSLWVSFALVVYYPLRFMFCYSLLSAVLALIGFPLTYYIGEQMGAATILTPYYYIIFGAAWMVAFPLINRIFNDGNISRRD